MSTDISWPADRLPRPTFDGYGLQPLDAAQRTDMESGTARQRLIFTAVPQRCPLRWRFDRYQFAIFEAWYKFKAERGAEWFSIELLAGLGLVPCEARFIGQGSTPYQATPMRGGRWIVTATLEARTVPTLNEEALDLFLAEDAELLLAAMEDFNAMVQSGLVAWLN